MVVVSILPVHLVTTEDELHGSVVAMKITIEVQYPDEKPKKYSYEDGCWDHGIDEMCEILGGLLQSMGFELKGKLEVADEEEIASREGD